MAESLNHSEQITFHPQYFCITNATGAGGTDYTD